MIERVKDLFSCGRPSCNEKSVISLEISDPDVEAAIISLQNVEDHEYHYSKIKRDTSILTNDFNTSTDISNYTKSVESNTIFKQNISLNQIREELEDEQVDGYLFSESPKKNEDKLRKNNRKSAAKQIENTKAYWVDKILILDQEINNSKSFQLEDEHGSLLFNQKITLNAAGLVNSIRQLRDGYAFFGTVDCYKNFIINDFIVNKEKSQHNKRLFMIYFNRKESRFFVKNLEESKASVYIKLTRSLFVESKSYAQIGDELLKFEITNNNTLEIIAVNNKTSMKYLFPPSIKTITVGRSNNCNVIIQSNLLSKIQCTLRFRESVQKWEICDGIDKKPSTNGSWFLSHNPIPLCGNDDSAEEIHIKIGQEIIKLTKL